MSGVRLLIWMFALAMVGCGEDAGTPTSPSATSTSATILFSGMLQPGAMRFYSYTLSAAGPVTAMLASLERNGVPMPNALELGLGVPAGTGCAASVAQTTTSSLIPQIRQDASIGTYCVRISDTEGLPGPMTFTIRVIHP